MRILVVSHDEQASRFLKHELEKADHVVDCTFPSFDLPDRLVNAGKEGKDYSLLFIDLDMLEINALELFGEIRGARPDLGVVAVISTSNEHKATEAIHLGITDCLHKPISQHEIHIAVSRAEQKRIHEDKKTLEIGMAFKQEYAKYDRGTCRQDQAVGGQVSRYLREHRNRYGDTQARYDSFIGKQGI
ncbi:MAG: response regulator [Dehalococcoidia bacterium]